MFQTLSARLTLLYTLLFALLSLIVFAVVDYSLETRLLNRIDTDFLTDGRECLHIYQESGIEGIAHEINLETMGSGGNDMFMRLYSPDFKVIVSSRLDNWADLPDHTEQLEKARKTPFQTITLLPRSEQARIFFQEMGDGHLLQFGKLLREDMQLLKNFRRVFYLSFSFMLLCGILLGFYLARRALAGVVRVQQGAEQICRGDLSQRIVYRGGSEEVRNLTLSFNQMQDRIQTLIGELQDVTNNVAHDLRSPITRIRGLAETTLTGDQSLEDYRDLAGAVVEESDRLVGMINVMLEIAETDAGLRAPVKEPVDLRKMIQDVTELYSSVAQDKEILLVANLTDEELILYGDRSRLQRALANLIDNAVKFTPPAGRIELSARVEDQNIVVSITDNGPGIPADDLPRVFDRFYRGDQSRSTPGSGLGLTLVKSIVRAHHGDIRVDNLVPQGLRVELSFPTEL